MGQLCLHVRDGLLGVSGRLIVGERLDGEFTSTLHEEISRITLSVPGCHLSSPFSRNTLFIRHTLSSVIVGSDRPFSGVSCHSINRRQNRH